MIAIVTDPKVAPDQIGHPLRGPNGGSKPISLGPPRQQARELSQLPRRQLGRASRTEAAEQARSPLASASVPDIDRLAGNAQLARYRRKRLARLQQRQGGQTPGFHRGGISSETYGRVGHKPTLSPIFHLSTYLYRGL